MNAPSSHEINRLESKGDVWGLFLNRLLNKRRQAAVKVWTLYSRLQCAIWKVHLGSKCCFWGRMHIWRIAKSKIEIGTQCRFRSAHWSNRVGINRPCALSTIRPGALLSVGNNCGFSGTVISAASSIVLGDNILCGANVTITDTDWHHIDKAKEGKQQAPSAPVVIKDNVWLGMNVTVLKGVTIGRGSVIAPHSVVTKDIPEGVLAGGQPARVIRELNEVIELMNTGETQR